MIVLYSESLLSSSIKSRTSKARGLFQIMPATIITLNNYARSKNPKHEDIIHNNVKEMKPLLQLELLDMYFDYHINEHHDKHYNDKYNSNPFPKGLLNMYQIKLIILYPRAINYKDDDALFALSINKGHYNGNKGLDYNNDGKI